MKLYLAHSRGYDYQTELYEPLKSVFAGEHDIIYPHDIKSNGVKSKDVIPECDMVLAEVSYPSTGQGIELGWADSANIPIICFYKTGSEVSSALRFISESVEAYGTREEMVNILKTVFENHIYT